MSDTDHAHDAVERLEFADRKEAAAGVSGMTESGFDRRAFLRRTALTGVAVGSVSTLLEACGTSASTSSSNAIFGSHPEYKFTFVNHVTTNPFFTPTIYGIQDACKLLGCSYAWTGSETSNVSQMVNALNSAVAAKVNGIAVSLIDPTAFNAPVQNALNAGVPVVAYNADVKTNPRLAYIGQDLEYSGELMGEHIAELVPSGDVALFIATPGSLNIQPRINGALKTLAKHPSITTHVVATGASVPGELTVIESYYAGHPETKGMFAVDAGSTEGVVKTIEKHSAQEKVKGGGYDMLVVTQQGLSKGYIEFTIDQQPYLQGFFPTLELFLYNVSKHLTGLAEVDTGITFHNKETIQPYVTTTSRYEGSSSSPGVS